VTIVPVVQPSWRSAPIHVALRFIPAAVVMAIIFALSSRRTLPKTPGLTPELVSIAGHFTVYAALAASLWWGLGSFALPPGRRLALAFGGALLYGLSDEWHQSFIPGRDPAVFDILVDSIGAVCGLAVAQLLLRDRGGAPESVRAQ
jgi:VanZ family protein